MTVHRIGVLSLGRVLAVLHALFGLLAGAILALGAVLGMTGEPGDNVGAALFGAGAVLILPVLYGAAGFLGGILIAFFYNLVAGAIGGLEVDIR